ncbi:RcnB family protein [Lysobacter sp. P5_B9]
MRKLIIVTLAAGAFAAAPVLAGHGAEHKDHVATAGHGPKAEGHHDNGLHRGWQKQAWKRGDRIAWTEVDPRYYVNDYRAYRLSAPPAGYRWIRPMDDRYLLVDAASGIVAQALGY